MKISKRQLLQIIKEEKEKLKEMPVTEAEDDERPDDHHWPRVDWSDVGDLVDKWERRELDSYDADRMPVKGPTEADKRQHWAELCDTAAMDLEAELTTTIRKAALAAMKEFSRKLMSGEYS
jgi:hypothetical protein